MPDNGCSLQLAAGGFILMVLVVAAMILIPQAIQSIDDSRTDRIHAEAGLVQAKADAEHQANVDWEHQFMLWTAYLTTTQTKATDAITLIIIAALAALASLAPLLGYTIGYYLSRRNPNASNHT